MKVLENYIFTNKKTGEVEKVVPERWGWGVLYKPTEEQIKLAQVNHTEPERDELHQFSSDGTFHQFSEVDQDRVQLFVVYRLDNPSKRIDIVKQEGEVFFAKYRNVKPFYCDYFVRVYMFGVKKPDGTYQNNFILPDDRLIQTSKDNVDLVKFELNRI